VLEGWTKPRHGGCVIRFKLEDEEIGCCTRGDVEPERLMLPPEVDVARVDVATEIDVAPGLATVGLLPKLMLFVTSEGP
ncbi:hypothetical protein Tco_1003242, partial [Tanacetum coccineum]